jgi:hypothetical protein
MSQTSVMQGALLRNRNRRIARLLMQTEVSPWSALTVVESGMYVTTDNGQTLLYANAGGTTGSAAPTHPTYSDTISWSAASSQVLLQYRFSSSGVPTP